jgi:uncharacterized membrane protein
MNDDQKQFLLGFLITLPIAIGFTLLFMGLFKLLGF